MESRCVASLAGRDLRLFTSKGQSITSVDPDVVVNGIVSYTVSVYQHMVFVLMESGILNVYCSRSGSVPGEWSTTLRSLPNWAKGSVNVEQEVVVCMTLINVMPSSALKPSSADNSRFNHDLRGQSVPENIDEVIVLGCRSGSLIFLDTMNDCRVVYVLQAHQSQVGQVQYRHLRQELFTLGCVGDQSDTSNNNTTIRVWRLPSMQCICEVKGLAHVSPQDTYPNSFAISDYLPFFAVGCTDGDVRVFIVVNSHSQESEPSSSIDTAKDSNSNVSYGIGEGPALLGRPSAGTKSAAAGYRIQAGSDVSKVGFGYLEVVLRSGDNHNAPVTAISFCDELQLYASASADRVVKIWTCEKKIVRTISFNMPTVSLLFNNAINAGDCIFTQYSYLLNIKRKIWDDGGALSSTREMTESAVDDRFFVADPEVKTGLRNIRPTKNKMLGNTENSAVESSALSAYYTQRGGKYRLGSFDPIAPQYEKTKKFQLQISNRHHTETNKFTKNMQHVQWPKSPIHALPSTIWNNNEMLDRESHGEFWGQDIDTRSPRMYVPAVSTTRYDLSGREFHTAADSRYPGEQDATFGVEGSNLSNTQQLGLGARGATVLLLSSPTKKNNAAELSATSNNVVLDEESYIDDAASDEEDGNGVLLPSVLLERARNNANRGNRNIQKSHIMLDMNELDPAHAHNSDTHHFDLTDRQRKALQQKMHQRRGHRMGRDDKEIKQLQEIGALGVVPVGYHVAKDERRRSMNNRMAVLGLGASSNSTVSKTFENGINAGLFLPVSSKAAGTEDRANENITPMAPPGEPAAKGPSRSHRLAR